MCELNFGDQFGPSPTSMESVSNDSEPRFHCLHIGSRLLWLHLKDIHAEMCLGNYKQFWFFLLLLGFFFVIHEGVMGTLRVKKPKFFKMSPYTLF